MHQADVRPARTWSDVLSAAPKLILFVTAEIFRSAFLNGHAVYTRILEFDSPTL